MVRRELSFTTYREVIEEIERLRKGGYERLGEWTLGQICFHLSYYVRGSLEGYPFKLPWVVRKLIGRPMLRRVLRKGRMADGGRTIPGSLPPDVVDEMEAVGEAKELFARLAKRTEDPHPSPLFDHLTADECRSLHLLHAAHHLGFLEPQTE
jgi:hypothetical protein